MPAAWSSILMKSPTPSGGLPVDAFPLAVLASVAAGVVVFWLLPHLLRRFRSSRRLDSLGTEAAQTTGPEFGETGSEDALHVVGFDERPIEDVERAFEDLLVKGILTGEPATPDALASARVPAHAGPVFRRLARRFRSVRLSELDISIALHDGEIAHDALGGWCLRSEPAELDIRLAPTDGPSSDADGEAILDATWSPRASGEVARHSTILHFLVRAAVGDRF